MWDHSATGEGAAASAGTKTLTTTTTTTLLQTLLVLAAVGASPVSSPQYSPPEFLTPCHRSDPELNGCLRQTLNKLLPQMASGLPKLDMPPLDPLELPLVDLSGSVEGNLTLSLILRDVRLAGFSKTTVLLVRANPAERKFEVTSRIPILSASGHFDASGAVLTFPLSGQGAFDINMTEVSATCILYYKEEPETPGGPDIISLDDFELDLAPTDVTFHFGDRIDGDNHLAEAINEFLNANAHEVFGDVRTRASAILASALRDMADALLMSFPAQSLLPD